jgi:DNA-binding NtrC family response regulator
VTAATLRFPAAEASGVYPIAASPRQRVLVVDDERALRTSIRRALSREHDVIDVGSVAEALALLDAGTQFDVILTDLVMPDTDGMTFSRLLEERYPVLARRVVFVTGGPMTVMAANFLRATTRPVLQKPFATARLREAVRAVGEGTEVPKSCEFARAG